MSDTVGVGELRRNLSKYLRRVEQGERLVVTDRNRPVAELSPPPPSGSRLDELIAAGKVVPARRRRPRFMPLVVDELPRNALSRALDELREDDR